MRRVIEGKVYDTLTSAHLCDISLKGLMRGDFEWEDTGLYKSPRGAYFLAGEGGARTRWAEKIAGGSQGGSGIEIVTEAEAKAMVERYAPHSYEEIFGAAEEG